MISPHSAGKIPSAHRAPEQDNASLSRRSFIKASAVAAVFPWMASEGAGSLATSAEPISGEGDAIVSDVFVYGSTPSGVAAAIEAARRGCRVLLACPRRHPGGMTASGLCASDTGGRRDLFGGFVDELSARISREYLRSLGSTLKRGFGGHEPSVAEKVFEEMLAEQEERLEYRREHHLMEVRIEEGRITEAALLSPQGATLRVEARIFVDATYEGDLAACAKVPYRVGREGREEYGESKAGIHYMNWRTGEILMTPDTGEPSSAIQAFCARSVFTDDPDHLVPIEKPDTYEQHLQDFLPLLRDFEERRITSWRPGSPLPRRKYEMNGRIDWQTSINCPGVSWSWPEADRFHRERLAQFHVDHTAGLVWFLQNHPGVPVNIARSMQSIGLHDHEFVDNGNWPWQIYVRQGRRIEGRALVTQHNFTPDPRSGCTPQVEQPVALGTYAFDVHPCHDRRYAVEGLMEGVLWYHRKLERPTRPGQIPYGALLPRRLSNLIVPVGLSATHIGMSVVRMEPVWMTTGQVAGLAAATAVQTRTALASLDVTKFPEMLKIPIADPRQPG